MTEPNPTPGADVLTDARGAAAFRDAIAFELRGTPFVGVLVETSYDWATDTTVIRARVGITIEGAFKLDGAVELDDRDAYLNDHARRMGQDMRHEWDKVTGIADLIAENQKLRDVIRQQRVKPRPVR